MKRIKKIICSVILGIAAVILAVLSVNAAGEQTIYNSPYVSFSPDGKAWTTNAGDKNYTWYQNKETVSTGISSTIRELETGEHYYKVSRTGTIPIGYWEVEFTKGSCVHDTYPSNGEFHDVDYGTRKCMGYYYSGWTPYCADCGEQIVNMNFYMSKEVAESIDYLETETDYYYLCPHCTNLEQGSSIGEHKCKEISWNQYKVIYDSNTKGITYGGYMESSFHMYNNATEYEGEPVTPITHLTKNTYTIMGYEFVGWNTEPDGSGTNYADGAEIYNLSLADWNNSDTWNNGDTGVITLYAQWRPSASTLQIDPAGGTYQGNSGITAMTKDYGSTYTVDNDALTAPAGHTLAFNTNGGASVASITGTQHFVEWSMQDPFAGRFLRGRYFFMAPDGNVDTIKAIYALDPITLPDASKQGSSFGGWYYDEEFENPAGGPGDTIIPDKDMTLYAQWVDLKLSAEDNYSANKGKGAVDLFWSQSDNNNKTYLIYQSRDGENWIRINSAEDISNDKKVEKDFTYTGSVKTYTVPYTGFYTLTAGGAQGGSYNSYQGGKGGRVTGKFWLQKGEVITYTIGGQNGYNGGGEATMYGNGGGCTVVTSDKKGTLLIAGAGGGATITGAGGVGGSSASVIVTGIDGEDGGAGGGGGYRGGKAGEYIVHTHTDECYHVDDLSYTLLDKNSGYLNEWMQTYQGGQTLGQGTIGTPCMGLWNTHSNSFSIYGVYAHSKENPWSARYVLGAVENGINYGAPSWSPNYIPTNGNTTVEYTIRYYVWGGGGYLSRDNTYLKIYDQNNNLIFSQTLTQNMEGTSSSSGSAWEDDSGWHGTPSVTDSYFAGSLKLPEGTTGIYLYMYAIGNGDAWVSIDVQKVSFSGGENKFTICGYEEGQILSSKPAYGGSNYVNTTYCSNYTSNAGTVTGNGRFSIRSEKIGYMETLELKGVTAMDMAAPDSISLSTVKKEANGNDRIKVTWAAPADHGTDYYHVAESYLGGSENMLCRSNVTLNTLVSGIKGYYYRLDNNSGGTVNASNGTFLSDHNGTGGMTVSLSQTDQYLHVTSVDVAGNIGETVHIKIGSVEEAEDVLWNLYTEQLIIDEADNVCRATQDRTYYVRSDGETPFTLHFGAYMDGPATTDYQPNYIIFESRVEETISKNIFTIPSEAVQDGNISVPAGKVTYTAVDDPLLSRGTYTVINRKEKLRQLEAVQKFFLSTEASGKEILLTPVVGADYLGETFYSDHQTDVQHSLILIGDGEAPVIRGLDILDNLELIDRRDGTVTLYVNATDDLSGVKDFYIKIYNTDNAVEKTYTPEADGSIRIIITEDEPVFSGDFTLTAYAVDNVGNNRTEEYRTTEFALETKIERILSPHDPIFKCGESGILTITTWGYADRVEVEFPAEMVARNPELNTTYIYTMTPKYQQVETLQFMIPLYMPQNTSYTITVRAYKDDKKLEEYPDLSVIEVNGSVLDEIRTRLR